MEYAFVVAVQQRFRPRLDRVAVVSKWLVTDESICLVLAVLTVAVLPREGALLGVYLSVSEVLNGLVKWAVQRPRPAWLAAHVRTPAGLVVATPPGAFERDYSFPSSHAQVSATLGTALLIGGVWEVLPWSPWVAVAVVAAVAWLGAARVYLGQHYPSDVIAGWLLGVIVPLMLERLELLETFPTLEPLPRLALGPALALATYALLAVVRAAVPAPAPELLALWKRGVKESVQAGIPAESAGGALATPAPAPAPTDILRPRFLAKYDFQIMSLCGGILATAACFLDPASRFLHEACFFADLAAAGTRILVVLPFTFFFFGLAFVVARRDNFGARLLRITAILAASFWMSYLGPATSHALFGTECTIAREPHGAFHQPPQPCSPLASRALCAGEEPPTRAAVAVTLGVSTVTSLEDLQARVRHAAATGQHLRIVGSGHSAIFSQATKYNLAAAAAGGPPAPQLLTLAAPAFAGYTLHAAAGGFGPLVTAGAGLMVGTCGEAACGACGNKTWADSLVERLWRDGLALPNLPGAVVQTVGGLFASGSDGGSVRFGLSRALVGVSFVAGTGALRHAWANDTTPEGMLRWKAAKLAVGLGGAIVSVVLAPEPAYCVGGFPRPVAYPLRSYVHDFDPGVVGSRETVVNTIAPAVAWQLSVPDYARTLFFPLAREHLTGPGRAQRATVSLLTEGIMYNRTLPASCAGAPAADVVFANPDQAFVPEFNQLLISMLVWVGAQLQCCGAVSLARLQSSAAFKTAAAAAQNGPAWQATSLEVCSHYLLQLDPERVRQFGLDTRAYMTCTAGAIAAPYTVVGEPAGAADYRTAPPHHELPMDHNVVRAMHHVALGEVFWPLPLEPGASEDLVLAALESALQRVLPVLLAAQLAVGVAVPAYAFELYMSPGSDALLSPTNGRPALRISQLASASLLDVDDLHARIWRALVVASSAAGRAAALPLHLGKMLPVRARDADLLCAFRRGIAADKLAAFRAWVGQEDPQGVFTDAFWSRALFDEQVDC